jgi:hypothetical protein
MRNRSRFVAPALRVTAAFGLLLSTAVVAQQPVYADDPTVPTVAEVVPGSGANMIIECKWEIVDRSPTDLAMTYGAPFDDDNPNVDATGAPCDAPAVSGQTPGPMENNRRRMVQIRPNTHDEPITRQYEKWVSVYSAAVGSIIDVYWKVWEPYVGTNPPSPAQAGCTVEQFPDPGNPSSTLPYCLKYQHHATANRLPPTASNPLVWVGCDQLQAYRPTMFQQAINTGQMTPAEADYIIEKCFQNEKRTFRVQEDISKEQPCGEYRVEVTVVNSAPSTFRLVDYFDVICFGALALDFNTVNWGQILNNTDNYVSGDLVMQSPVGANPPTGQNQGNDPQVFSIHYNPLRLVADPTKMITRFDLKLRASWQTNPASISEIPIINASQWGCFPRHPIAYNQTAKIDLSVHPSAAEPGTYNGSVDITLAPGCVPGAIIAN